ncbi:MAG: TatD family hydrolase [Christensenellales bacterium]
MATSRLFDSHCHLDDEQFDQDRDEVITSLPEGGIAACVAVGSDLSSSAKCLALAHRWPFIHAAAGVHPHAAAQAPEAYLEALERLLAQEKAVAVGEIGLDYHYDFSPKATQRKLLEEQLDLAFTLHLPVILHVREAHGDLIEILRGRGQRLSGGIIHCFSGSAETAMDYVRLGFMISFAGSLTFKNAEKLRLAAQKTPLEHLLIETDSPYLAPEPLRGRRNTPANVQYVCQVLAQLRGMTPQEMAELTFRNAARVFRLPELQGPALPS